MKKKALVIDDYKEWLEENGVSRFEPYCEFINKVFYPDNNGDILFADIIVSFLHLGQPAYANAFLSQMRNSVINKKEISYQKKFEHYIYRRYRDRIFNNPKYTINDKTIGKIKQHIKKESPEFHIDAMLPLIESFNTKKFVRLAIESSYFFNKVFVKERHNEIIVDIKNRNNLMQRKSKETPTEINESIKEFSGNEAVIKIIREKTGYTIARGENSVFHNYIISHIWGKATDFRYYTNFWNIVIIPAWANHLMDKDVEDGLASILKNTFMAICNKLYNMESLKWDSIDLKCPKPDYQQNIQTGEYWLQIINDKDDCTLATSSISKQKIKL